MRRALMWGSLGLIAWAHAGYPLAAAVAARLRRYSPHRDEDFVPDVALIIAAHNEEGAIQAQLENALRFDYPRKRLDIVVASDGSHDGTGAVVERFAHEGIRLLDLPRAGKVAAQNAAARATNGEVLAFSDAHSPWEPEALRLLVRNLADPEVGYACGKVEREEGVGDDGESLYWRFELWLREQESACGSLTAGSGAIYAVRRAAFLELGPQHSHDIGLPHRLRRRGLRSVYEPTAIAREPGPTTTHEDWPRKVRMLSRAWWEVLRGGLLDPRGQPPGFFGALLSHRFLRYSSGPLHLVLLASSAALAPRDRGARALLGVQVAFAALALAGRRRPGQIPFSGAAWYYVVVNAASLVGLTRTLGRRPHLTWLPAREEP